MRPLDKSEIPPEKHVKYLYMQLTYPPDRSQCQESKCIAFGILTRDGTFHYDELWFEKSFSTITTTHLRNIHEAVFGRYVFTDESLVAYSDNFKEKDIVRQLFRLLGKFARFEFLPVKEHAIYRGLNHFNALYKRYNHDFTQKLRKVIRDKLIEGTRIPWVSNDFRLFVSNQNSFKQRRMKEVSVAVYYLMLREKKRIIPLRKHKLKKKLLEEEAKKHEAEQPI